MTLPAVRRAVCHATNVGGVLAQLSISIGRLSNPFGTLETALPVRSHGVRRVAEPSNRTLHLISVLRP